MKKRGQVWIKAGNISSRFQTQSSLRKKLGQVWIETVIYTMIAFVLIAAVLAFVKPKIEEMQDRTLIDQTERVIEEINLKILDIVEIGRAHV